MKEVEELSNDFCSGKYTPFMVSITNTSFLIQIYKNHILHVELENDLIFNHYSQRDKQIYTIAAAFIHTWRSFKLSVVDRTSWKEFEDIIGMLSYRYIVKCILNSVTLYNDSATSLSPDTLLYIFYS